MNSHAAVIAASRGFCATDPRCERPALVTDDDQPTIRRCGVHARTHLAAPPVFRTDYCGPTCTCHTTGAPA